MRVLSVVSELFPVIKTGGLADVAGALPAALAPLGVRMVTLLPGYPAVLAALAAAQELRVYPDLFGGPARLLAGETAGLALFVIDAPHLYARQGNPYVGPDGRDWPDNGLRFAALGAVASDVGAGSVAGFVPDVVHAHDWQAGLAPAYLHYNLRRRPGTIMTVHNLAFQGQFPPQLLPVLGLPPESFTIEGVEYYGAIGYLKAGLRLADRITTVSPTYAAEIQTDAGGMGLAGLLRSRARDLAGILNGIDVTAWDPAADALIPEPFDAGSLARRAADKAALQARLGLARDPGMLLFGVVSRLTWQKGMDLLREALPVLLGLPAQLAMIGSGDPGLEAEFLRAAAEHPGRVGVRLGYDERLAHLVQAGADALIVPSRFEPCGLTQLCALRYGALPVVARVGGLADTVIDANEMALAAGVATGFQFSPPAGDALVAGLRRAAAVWAAPETWRAMQRNAMRCDVSWRGPAARYAALYNEVGR